MWQEIVAATPSHRGAMTELPAELQMGDDELEGLQEVLQPDVSHECNESFCICTRHLRFSL